MSGHNQRLGRKGEDIASAYLAGKGYRILARNWRYKHAEIDLICMEGKNILVFVEVKTRVSKGFGNPEESISPAKQRIMLEGAEAFMMENNLDMPARFDVIAIEKQGNAFQIRHIQDAFYPVDDGGE